MAYSASIELAAGLKPKNNGDFPLISSHDVYIDDETRLDDIVRKYQTKDYFIANFYTTEDELTAAYNAGKKLFVYYDQRLYSFYKRYTYQATGRYDYYFARISTGPGHDVAITHDIDTVGYLETCYISHDEWYHTVYPFLTQEQVINKLENYGVVPMAVAGRDHAPALKAALESGKPVVLGSDLHLYSSIDIKDVDVHLDGNGHTIYLHGENMEGNTAKGGSGGNCISIGSTWNDGIIEDADVVIYTEDGTENVDPAFPEVCAYHRGYLSYHGFNPTPDKESYEHYSTHSWKEVKVDIRNVNFVGDHTDGLRYLCLNLVCNSTIDNCSFLCTTADGAAIGVQANYCYNVMLSRIRAEGFTANSSRSIVHTGYGIQAIGDAITISNCILKNCKNHINIGGGSGNSGIFTTGVLVDNCIMQTEDTGELVTDGSGAKLYQQMLDLHEGCHHPILSNIVLEYMNSMNAENYGTLIHLSCPEATITNLYCRFQQTYGQWAIGYLGFGPLAKRYELNNVHAENCYLFAHGWGFEREQQYDANRIREIRINGGEIGGIMGLRKLSSGLVKIRLSGVHIGGMVQCSNLYAENCVFQNENRPDNGAQIVIEQEGFFTNCDIYGYTLGNYKRSKPLIDAPENSLYITGCILRKPLDAPLFKTEQTHLVNNAVWDLFGLVLGSRTSALYSDGDACELDSYNLW